MKLSTAYLNHYNTLSQVTAEEPIESTSDLGRLVMIRTDTKDILITREDLINAATAFAFCVMEKTK